MSPPENNLGALFPDSSLRQTWFKDWCQLPANQGFGVRIRNSSGHLSSWQCFAPEWMQWWLQVGRSKRSHVACTGISCRAPCCRDLCVAFSPLWSFQAATGRGLGPCLLIPWFTAWRNQHLTPLLMLAASTVLFLNIAGKFLLTVTWQNQSLCLEE